MVFGPNRNVIEVARRFMDFFVEESCGYCTPCRVGNVLLRAKLDDILEGRGGVDDIAYLEELCATVKLMSRCGLGQTSPNPVATTIRNFRPVYDDLLKPPGEDGFLPAFDIRAAVASGEEAAGRKSVVYTG
jgi:[NiFe] hydrogenase diaphorase moiety large subunit